VVTIERARRRLLGGDLSYEDPGAADVINRATIRMPYLSDKTTAEVERLGSTLVVSPTTTIRVRRAAEQLAAQFRRETRYDFAPYSADEPEGRHVVLLRARQYMIAYGALYCGAIGIEPAAMYEGWEHPVARARWVYLHPYVRGEALVEEVWPLVSQRWPGVTLAGPFTDAGLALVRSLVRAGKHPADLYGIDVEKLH
jgi:hypothetical protein